MHFYSYMHIAHAINLILKWYKKHRNFKMQQHTTNDKRASKQNSTRIKLKYTILVNLIKRDREMVSIASL